MKRRNKIIALLCAAVLLTGIIAAEKAVTRHVDSLNSTDELVYSVTPDAVSAISFTTEDGSIAFTKTDGTWHWDEDEAFPVDDAAMTALLQHLEEVHASFSVEDVADYGQYGLEEPSATITVTTEEESATISLGGYSTMDEKRYITLGGDKVYLIDEDLMDYLDTDKDSYLLRDTLDVPDTVERVTITGDTELALSYDPDGVYTYTEAFDYYLLRGDKQLALDTTNAQNLIGTLTGLSLESYVTYRASEEDLSQWGLDEPAYTITVTGKSGEEGAETETGFTLQIGTVTEEAQSEDEEPTITAYLRPEGSEIIYTLSDSARKTISNASYDTLRPQDVVSLDWGAVQAVDLSYDGQSYHLYYGELPEEETGETEEAAETTETATDDADEDDGMGWMLDGTEVPMSELKQMVNELWISSFTDEKPAKQEELALTLSLDNADYPEISIVIYRYDGNNCLVVVDGETVGLMSREHMVDLREAMTSIALGLES